MVLSADDPINHPSHYQSKTGLESIDVIEAFDLVTAGEKFCGNFRLPWVQHRKMIPGEAVFGSVP